MPLSDLLGILAGCAIYFSIIGYLALRRKVNRGTWLCVDCWRRRWWVSTGSFPFGYVQAPCPWHQYKQFGNVVKYTRKGLA